MLATVKREPRSLLRDFQDDMERWFYSPLSPLEGEAKWTPSVDIVEEKDRYLFRADLPGVEHKDIEVLFDDGMLTIKGERTVEKDEEQKGYRRIERSYGSFQRSFRMPDTIDADNITAKSEKGVLEVQIPKLEKAQRKIEIQQ